MFKQSLFRFAVVLTFSVMLATGMLQNIAPALAATDSLTINVNDNADVPDKKPGDGKCLTAVNTCTLRAAIMEANKHSGMDVINLQSKQTYKLTRVGDDDNALNGDLDITEAVDLNGNGATVDANGDVTGDRAFEIYTHPSDETYSHIQNLKITGGKAYIGGGIYIYGRVSLDHVTVTKNHADARGGGISNSGYLHMRYSTISNNACGCASDQQPGGGGMDTSGWAYIESSTINNNISHWDGGGILSWDSDTDLVIENSTIALNQATRNGGGMDIENVFAYGQLFNSTVADNFADANADGNGTGGGIYVASGDFQIANTIIADNLNTEPSLWKADDCSGTLDSLGYNLLRTTKNCSIGATNNLLGAAPQLDVFGAYGGPTKTIALKSNSPAIDAGNPTSDCKNISWDTGPAQDQRMYQRIVDGNSDNTPRCDMGAYEYNAQAVKAPCSEKPDVPVLKKVNPAGVQALLTFSAVCAENYQVTVRQDKSGGNIVDQVTGLTTTQYLTAALAKNHKYFWQVKACNVYGCSKSVWGSFKFN